MAILDSYKEDVAGRSMKYKVKSHLNPIDIMDYFDNYYFLKLSMRDVLHRQIELLEEKAIKNP